MIWLLSETPYAASEGVLFTLSSGDLHMTVYGAAGQAERTLRQLAAGEGLYVWAHGEE